MLRRLFIGIVFFIPLLTFFLVSCDKDSTTEPKTETIILTKVSGDNQQGVQGDTLSTALTVLVTDRDGKAILDKKINFKITEGEGTLLVESINTDNNGRASTILTLGDQQGLIRVEAKISGTNISVSFTAVVGTDEPHSILIAFVSERDGNAEIYVMDSDGSNQTRLTNNSSNDYFPSWSPDGSQIAFQSGKHGFCPEIYIMDADGSNQSNLTNHPDSDGHPSWSPILSR